MFGKIRIICEDFLDANLDLSNHTKQVLGFSPHFVQYLFNICIDFEVGGTFRSGEFACRDHCFSPHFSLCSAGADDFRQVPTGRAGPRLHVWSLALMAFITSSLVVCCCCPNTFFSSSSVPFFCWHFYSSPINSDPMYHVSANLNLFLFRHLSLMNFPGF